MSKAEGPNRRILIVDDSPAIHADFRKILAAPSPTELDAARAAFLGARGASAPADLAFELDSAHQGQEALGRVQAALGENRPYAMAFVDVRMPPGWDGIETLEHLWRVAPDLQAVICTAYSDYSWEQTFRRLGRSDRLLILKKPFDPIEISQLALALTEKWNAERRVRGLIEDLRRKEQEARAYASSLETVNRALETSKAAAERSSQMKTEFLVQLSQEIWNKVSGVLGEVERLCEPTSLESIPLAQLDCVLHSSRYLLGTLEEVADIALIDSGRLETHSVFFAPAEPLREVIEELRAAAESKSLALELELCDPLPAAVLGDPLRVRQILRNLVSNAIQYTERGGVRLALSAGSGAWSSTTLSYVVEDTGPGIPRQRLGRLFEPFARPPEDAAGAGLGLAHSQRLARLLGGDVRVHSEPGRGSRFEFVLEVGVAQPVGE